MQTTIVATTIEDLYEAIYTAVEGETILLAGGDYGVLSLALGPDGLPAVPSDLVLMSADASRPAMFAGLDLAGVQGLTLDSVGFAPGTGADDIRLAADAEVMIVNPLATAPATLAAIDSAPGMTVLDDATLDQSIARNDAGPTPAPAEFAPAGDTPQAPAAAVAIVVSTPAELNSALASATGGETILLKGGDYGVFNSGARPATTVTLASADPANPAVFTGMTLSKAANLTLDGISFDYTYKAGDPTWLRPFNVNDSTGIAIRNSVFDGDFPSGVSAIEDGYGTAVGLSVRLSAGVTVEGNEFRDFHRGVLFQQSRDLVVTGNDVHSMRSDGMNFAEVQRVRIENNFLHDFRQSPASADHQDMIQFWTNGTKTPNTDIVIRGNRLDIADGTWTQSIFMRNEEVDTGRAGAEMFYRNVTIEENVIVNAHAHGISVGETNGLTIRNNTVVHADGGNDDGLDSSVELPRISVSSASTDVTIANNATHSITGHTGQAGWTIANNALVQDQDPAAPGWYGDAFVASSMQPTAEGHAFVALPGGLLDSLSAGAGVTRAPAIDDGLLTQFHVTPDPENASRLVFDATHSRTATGPVPEDAVFEWSFGDGTTAFGRKVAHAYAGGGLQEVTLTLRLPGGQTEVARLPLRLDGAEVLDFAPGAGFTAYDAGSPIELPDSARLTAEGLTLGGTGTSTSIAREHVVDLVGADEFTIDLGLKAASTASAGEVFRLHGSLIASMDSTGKFTLRAFPQGGGEVKLVTPLARLNDTAEHAISIRYAAGKLELWVDGALSTQTAMAKPLAGLSGHNLVFGEPWGGTNFSGLLTDMAITTQGSDFPAAPSTEILIASPTELPAPPPPPEPVVIPEAPLPPAPEPEPEPEPTEIPEAPLPPAPEPEPVPTEETLLDGVTLGAKGIAAAIDRAEVTDFLVGTDRFEISFGLDAASTASAGELFRLHGSLVAQVDAKGELVLRASGTDGGVTTLVTSGARLNDTNPHAVDIRYADDRLEIWVDGRLAGATAMEAPLTGLPGHDLVFGEPWGGKNFAGQLTGFELADMPTADMAYESLGRMAEPIGPADLAVYDANLGFVVNDDGLAVVLPDPAGVGDDGLALAARGLAATISRDHVSAIQGADEFRIDLTLDAASDRSAGEVMRLHESFTSSIDAKGEFVFQGFLENGTALRLSTRDAHLDDTTPHEVSLRHAEGRMEIWIDGKLNTSQAMAAPLAGTGNRDLTIGNPWNQGNFEGTLSTFEMSLDVRDAPNPIWTPDTDGFVPLA
jgi:hypothetical protein